MSVREFMGSARHDHLDALSQGTAIPIYHPGQPIHPPIDHTLC